MANLQPNKFALQSSDGKMKLDYETSTFIGHPSLNLTESPGPIRHFSGSQIRKLETEIGTLLTVTTRLSVDQGSTSFSVLIPAMTLAGNSEPQTFTTQAIVTSHSGPDSVPSTGVHETYQFIPMQGEASFVFSMFEQATSALTQTAAR